MGQNEKLAVESGLDFFEAFPQTSVQLLGSGNMAVQPTRVRAVPRQKNSQRVSNNRETLEMRRQNRKQNREGIWMLGHERKITASGRWEKHQLLCKHILSETIPGWVLREGVRAELTVFRFAKGAAGFLQGVPRFREAAFEPLDLGMRVGLRHKATHGERLIQRDRVWDLI